MPEFDKSTYADAARAYFRSKCVFRYHMKKIDEMSDDEVVQKCHFWQEEDISPNLCKRTRQCKKESEARRRADHLIAALSAS